MFKTTGLARKGLFLRNILPGLAVFALVMALYWPCLEHPFNFDDEIFLGDENVRLGRWTELLVPPASRFLTWLGFLVQYQLFGPHPAGFHAVSILLHALNSAVVFRILGVILSWNISGERLGTSEAKLPVMPFAWVGALVFALHPVQSESVLNIYQQSTLLGTLFTGLSFSCWMSKRPEKGWPATESVAFVFFLAALAARETAAILPLILWGFDGFFRGRWKPAGRLLPFIGLSGVAVLSHLSRDAGDFFPSLTLWAESTLLYAACQVKVVWLYVFLVLGLQPLNVDHHVLPLSSWADLSWWLSLSGWILAGWGLVRLRRYSVEATFFILVFFVFLIPTSSLLPRPDLAFEHRVYGGVLGFAGLAGLIGRGLFRGWPGGASGFLRGPLSDRRWAGVLTVSALAALLTLCAWGSARRIEVWSDPVSLWQDAVSKSPAKYRPNYNLGVLLMSSSPGRAEFYLTRAVEIDPSLPLAFRSLGQVYFEQARVEAARRLWLQALLLEPDDFDTHLALGRLYTKQNDFFAARKHLWTAVKLQPDNWEGHSQLAQLHLQFGLDEQAIEHAERALALNPGSSSLHFLLGDAVSLQSNWERAAELYEAGLQVSADNPSRLFRLAEIYRELGRMEKARQAVRAGLSLVTSASQRQRGERLLRELNASNQ